LIANIFLRTHKSAGVRARHPVRRRHTDAPQTCKL
jgi:hypothetical protein